MSGFDFIAKVLGVSWKVGAALALAAAVTRWLRSDGIVPFSTLDETLYQYLMVAGLIGAALAAMEVICVVGTILGSFVIAFASKVEEKRTRQVMALKNYTSLTYEYADVFTYLRHNNLKRFVAESSNSVLYNMYKACLLTSDDPDKGPYAIRIYYNVPNYIWTRIGNDSRLQNRPIPADPPWVRQPNPHGWMSR